MSYQHAVEDFRQSRRQAILEQLRARLAGRHADLLSFDDVRAKLKAGTGTSIGLQDVPLDAIVGSVGRYRDFTRSFLPKSGADKDRWAKVQLAVSHLSGVPPISLYKIGDCYFVLDGNHRVSVARQLGAPSIQAYVTEIETRVPLTPDDQPDDLILKAEYAGFLDKTRLDELRPEADLTVTLPGRYPLLLEHIDVHRYYMGLDLRRDISYQEAVVDFYDRVYLPVVRLIREQEILEEFPGRTEADLYLWLSMHRAELEDALGHPVEADIAAADLIEQLSPRPQRRFARFAESILHALTPDEMEEGPLPGAWRSERWAVRGSSRMFRDILVPVSGKESGWCAVTQAVEIARLENARLVGLHVVRSAADKDGEAARAVEAEFARRCEALGAKGRLAVAVGSVSRTICDRSRWADLVVTNLAHPPAAGAIPKLGSGFRILLRCSATPVLAVPAEPSVLRRPLVAYDGSPKAREAMFLATYLAARLRVPLLVISVEGGFQAPSAALADARTYLEAMEVEGVFVRETGPAAEAVLNTALAHDSDLILMGSYGLGPALEALLGSSVDGVLRASRQPILICQ